jgi:hypothetical protein
MGGSPPNASATALLVNFKASSILFPLTNSVAIEEVAIAAPHPNVLNLASVIILSFTLMYISMMSPQTGLPT